MGGESELDAKPEVQRFSGNCQIKDAADVRDCECKLSPRFGMVRLCDSDACRSMFDIMYVDYHNKYCSRVPTKVPNIEPVQVRTREPYTIFLKICYG